MSSKYTLTLSSEYELFGEWFKNSYKMDLPFDSIEEAREYMRRLMLTRQRSIAEYGGKVKQLVEEPLLGIVHETEGSRSAFDTRWIYTIHEET